MPPPFTLLAALLLAFAWAGCGGDAPDPPGASPAPERPRAATPTPTPTPAAGERRAPPRGAAWTHARVVRRLDGRRIRVQGRRVRLDAATIACGGIGEPARRVGGEPAWARFRCVQPTFPSGAVAGPDAIIVVAAVGAGVPAVTQRRLTRY